jgi:hypothetical protein
MKKGPSHTVEPRTSTELANAAVVSEKHGTVGDANDMDRMGKLPVLRVSSRKPRDTFPTYSQNFSDNSNFSPSLATLSCSATPGNTH